MRSVSDRPTFILNGFVFIAVIVLFMSLVLLLLPIDLWAVLFILPILATGLRIVRPNESKVLTFFGHYIGTIKKNGLYWTVPLSTSTRISLRLINFNTDKLKVNDLTGNPIEVGAVVVWRVKDAAQAAFNVDDYQEFVANQSDMTIRGIVASYPYDSVEGASLRGNPDHIAAELRGHLQAKLSLAGIVVEDVRLSHLAYAPEIAASMLKRQQAEAVLLARKYLIENAVNIVDDVLKYFVEDGKIDATNDKKMELVSNLLVSLTSDKDATPVVNVGS